MQIEPKNNYLLVEQEELPKHTAGGIYLPDKIDQEPRWYRVVEIGPGLPDMFGNIQRLDYKPGEYVYVFPHAVHKVNLRDYGTEYPDKEVLFLSEGDVLVRSDHPSELQFKPVGSYCIIRTIKLPEPKTAGGIYLPDKSVPPPSLARVVAVGSGYRTAATGFLQILTQALSPKAVPEHVAGLIREHVPLHVKPNDLVLVVATAPMKLKLDQFGIHDDNLFVIGELDILCTLQPGE